MDAPNFNGAPGACPWDDEDLGERDARDQCAHPDHWRRPSIGVIADGECRLCGASATTIAVQRARKLDLLKGTFVSATAFQDELERRR